ncbi:type I-F CRISPR-associated protein Csy2 [Paraburkholderia elongata]|uniref:Type I-F CRISPR-associated protein Csy2 n=1 Tax=Paraburkholderia elongata TaxID=2675747 RepID=A0A972NWD5_9BURK|nr:type I-F CRISPR-associated protein Csy2 [Paraburkholderia elongata]NPT60331.1 type I-F CRISPR-associated protein Csy2 [Paraburkholderia elongata]
MDEPAALVVLPRLQVQHANAISGSICWGFPSPTAFVGFAHALERNFSSELRKGFGGVGIICHQFHPQVCQSPGLRTHVFRLPRNPVGEDGGATALVEEGRAHMEISLVIAVKDDMPARSGEYFAEDLLTTAQGMRVAGGSILPTRDGKRFSAQWWPLADNLEGQTEVFRKLRRQLLPGFALVQREDLLAERLTEIRLQHPEGNSLDALLDLSRLNIEPDRPGPDKPDVRQWGVRKEPGWLVPLPVGYSALSPLYAPGKVRNARDSVTPFRFVEGLYSLGEWVGPYRLENVRQLLWHAETDPDNGIYRCINHYSAPFAID